MQRVSSILNLENHSVVHIRHPMVINNREQLIQIRKGGPPINNNQMVIHNKPLDVAHIPSLIATTSKPDSDLTLSAQMEYSLLTSSH